RKAARHFGCATDCRRPGNDCIRILNKSCELRCPSNPARIEELHRIRIELEDSCTLEEKRTTLFEERFERSEIENCWISFDLAEVRIDRCIECQVRRQAVLEIGAKRLLLRSS